MNEEIRIRIIAEAIAEAATKTLRELANTEKELADATDKASNSTKQANTEYSKQTGLIERLEKKLSDLKISRRASVDLGDIQAYNKEIEKTEQQLKELTGTTEKSASAFKTFGTMLLGFVAVDKIMEYSKAILSTAIETDKLRTAMSNAVGSNEDYLSSLSFLNKLSDDYGQNVNSLTKSYTSFIASSNLSNLSLEERQRIYGSLVKTGSALKLSSYEIDRAMRAVTDMFSKGNVQAEELKKQLSVIPGAFELSAKAMGVSTQELNKMLEKGQILAVDLLPKLARELENTYGEKAKSNLETVGGQWNRLGNSIINYTDKVNEATGFTKSLASIIEYFADNLTTIVDKFGATVKVLAVAAGSIMAIRLAIQTVIVVQTLWQGITQAGIILHGQLALAAMTTAKTTDGLSMANMRAAVAARTFNTALASNPFGVVLVALSALVGGYMLFRDKADEAIKKQEEFNKGLAESTAPVIQQTVRFQQLSQIVLDGNVAIDKRKEALQNLKKEFPNILEGVDNIKDAERNLGVILAKVNGEYAKRIELAVLAYKAEKTDEQIKNVTAAIAVLEGLQKTASNVSKSVRIMNDGLSVDRGNSTVKMSSDFERLGNTIEKGRGALEGLMKQKDSYASQSDKITNSLVINYDKELKAGKGKADKETEANKRIEKSLLDLESIRAKVLASTVSRYDETVKKTDKSIREYLLSIKNGGDQEVKDRKRVVEANAKLLDQQYSYILEMNMLRKVATAKSIKEIEKIEKEYRDDKLKAELKHWQLLLDENSAYILRLKARVNNGDKEAISELATAQTERLNLQKGFNEVSLNIAKNAADENKNIVKVGEEEHTDISNKEGDKRNRKVKKTSEESAEIMRKYYQIVLATTRSALDVYGSIWEDRISKANTATEKALLENERMWAEWASQIMDVFESFIEGGIVNGIVSAIAWIGKGIANTFTETSRIAQARLEDLTVHYEKVTGRWTNLISSHQSEIEKYYGSFMNLIPIIYEYDKALSDIDPNFIVENELNRAKIITDNYNKAIDAAKKEKEERLKVVEEEYKSKSEKERENHDTIIKNINEQFNRRIEAINKEFDARAARERQGFDANSLAIEENLTRELSKFLTNEDAKTSIFSEFNAKRSKIVEATALADTQIVEGMSQAEIDAINAAKDLRAEYFLDLQKWLNTELEFTINNEGQKRKEYTDTEKLRNKAQDEHDLNDLNYSIIQIQRNKDKNLAISAEEKVKNDAIEAETIRFNDIKLALDEKYESESAEIKEWYRNEEVRLTEEKNAKMQASSEILFAAIERGWNNTIAKAIEAYNAGAMTLDKLNQIIDAGNKIGNQIGVGDFVSEEDRRYIDWQLYANATKDEKKFIREQGLYEGDWSPEVLKQYIDWLKANGLTDSGYNRINYFMRGGVVERYANGTEYVQLGNNPAGIDTVPAMLTAGERVFTPEQNKALGNMSNWGVVEAISRIKTYRDIPVMEVDDTVLRMVNEHISMQKIAPYQINLQPLLDELAEVKETLRNLPINEFKWDAEGFHQYEKRRNSVIKRRNIRHGRS